jgi:hypothetical protein
MACRATMVSLLTEGAEWNWHITQMMEGRHRMSGHSQQYNAVGAGHATSYGGAVGAGGGTA